MTARLTRFDWQVAEVGIRRSERRWSKSTLLNPTELPGGGWSIRSERSWRVGVGFAGARPHTDEGSRARRAGCVVAWRSFDDSTAPRWLWVEVVPLVSEADAVSYVATGLDQLVPDSRPTHKPVDLRSVEGFDITGLSHPRAWEAATTDQQGRGFARVVTGHVGHVVFICQCSWHENGWTWQEASSVVMLQAGKIRSCLAERPGGSKRR